MKDTHTGFMGTYFIKDVVLRVAQAARVFAWVVLGIYAAQLLLTLGLTLTQMLHGGFAGLLFVDVAQNFLSIFEQALVGGVYFFILLGIAHFLLIFLDVEDNTRREARQ